MTPVSPHLFWQATPTDVSIFLNIFKNSSPPQFPTQKAQKVPRRNTRPNSENQAKIYKCSKEGFLAQFTVRTQHFDFSLSKFEMQDRNGWNIALGAMWSPRANFETRNGGLGRGSRVRCFPTNGRISSLHHALLLLLRIAFRIWVCTHPKRFPGFARKIFLFLRKILSTQISKNIFFQQEPPILYFEKTKHLLLAFTWSQSRSPPKK